MWRIIREELFIWPLLPVIPFGVIPMLAALSCLTHIGPVCPSV